MTDRTDSGSSLEPDEDQLRLKGSGGRVSVTVLKGNKKKQALDIVESVRSRYAKDIRTKQAG